ncbi:hypothetical protein GGR51DRAFT_294401 [Nemania sp. FL0031]|nr:hypothetical protein GGR51DRAFT_294401 [Nemania sp. FL0031]
MVQPTVLILPTLHIHTGVPTPTSGTLGQTVIYEQGSLTHGGKISNSDMSRISGPGAASGKSSRFIRQIHVSPFFLRWFLHTRRAGHCAAFPSIDRNVGGVWRGDYLRAGTHSNISSLPGTFDARCPIEILFLPFRPSLSIQCHVQKQPFILIRPTSRKRCINLAASPPSPRRVSRNELYQPRPYFAVERFAR